MSRAADGRDVEVAIVGTGHSGLCLASQLARRGRRSFVMLEKADSLGGTWRDNTYPGAACDSPAFSYCFSFEQKTDWSRKWAPQSEILAYMEHCADRYQLRPHMRFGTELASARFDDASLRWRLRTTTGEELSADVLAVGCGQLNRPKLPAIAGIDTFDGPCFHSARWDHTVDLRGKRVAVVGNAASAIQFIPEIAPQVEELTVFQRSANWMFPKNDRAYPGWERWIYSRVPAAAKLYRWWLWATHELRFPVILEHEWFVRRASEAAEEHLAELVSDPELRDALTPDYPIGAKRLLISDDYYPALGRDNVELITTPIESVEGDVVVTRDGQRHPVDVLIFATGFASTEFLAPMEVRGRGGKPLSSAWSDGAEAYLGVTVSGFPNMFLMYGPNTNLGHNSIIFMIECQVRYILDCLEQLRARGGRAMDLRPAIMARYNQALAGELDRTVWRRVSQSWYRDAAGRITNNWSGTTTRYWWRTRRADLSEYDVLGGD